MAVDLRALNSQVTAIASLLVAPETPKDALPADATLMAGSTEAGPLVDLTALAKAMGMALEAANPQAESGQGDATARDRDTARAQQDPTARESARQYGLSNSMSQSPVATSGQSWPAATLPQPPAELAPMLHTEAPAATQRETAIPVVPALVAGLHADTTRRTDPRRTDHKRVKRREEDERRQRHAPAHEYTEPDAGDDAAPSPADARLPATADSQDDVPQAHVSPRRPSYRDLTRVLHDAAQHAALQELALGRRVLLIAPAPHASVHDTTRLVAHLLWTNADGVGQARAYRARGELPGEAPPAGNGWYQWRMHRERGTNDEPKLVPSHVAAPKAGAAEHRPTAPMLTVRINAQGAAQPPARPIADHRAAWLHLLDRQRLLHDLGTQWSVLLVWSDLPVDAADKTSCPSNAAPCEPS